MMRTFQTTAHQPTGDYTLIWTVLEKYRDAGLLLLRLGFGLGFLLFHGWRKITGGPEAWERTGAAMSNFGIDFWPVFWGFMAAFSESVGAVLFMLGLFFQPVCFLLGFTMITATASHLARGDGWSGSTHPFKNTFVFFGLLAVGPGKYSLDELIRRKRNRS